MRFLIVCIFVLFGSIEAYSTKSSSAALTERLELAKQAVWRISSDKSNGTAFFVSSRHVVTNWHAIHDQNMASLSLQQEGNERRLSIKRLVSVSALHDLVLLEMEEDSAFHLTVRKKVVSDTEDLFLPGYPDGNDAFKYTLKIGPLKDFKDGIFIYFFVNRAGSGGPVLDANNRVVGVTSMGRHNYIRMIKGSILREFIAGDIGLNCKGLTLRNCIKLAIAHLQKQARMGSPIAQYTLAMMYDYGDGGEQNVPSARRWYQQHGGRMIPGLMQNVPSARRWYQRAAEQGYPPAQHTLGWMYSVGDGGEQSSSSARRWYQRAAEQGYAPTQYALGEDAYYWGANFSLAFKWFQQAAEQGDAAAQHSLGEMYYHGKGGKKNLPLARKWYQRAAEQGLVLAQYKLGKMYYHGKGGKKNLPSARKWYRRAAEQNYALAQYRLGKMYYYGKGGKKNLPLARQWYRRAAKQGFVLAQYRLGKMYYHGNGGKKDLFLARKWFQQAAEQGDAAAQHSLGEMYYHGKGGKKNLPLARQWYQLVAEPDYVPTQYNLEKMYYFVSDKENLGEEAIGTVQKKDTTVSQGDDKEKRKANPRLQQLPAVLYKNCRKIF